MKAKRSSITNEGRLRRAALFMLLGLGTEWISLNWQHPLSFYVFVAGGGLFALLGVGSFLQSLVAPPGKQESRPPAPSVEEFEEEPARAANG